jgi:hypothetical protein
VDQGVTPAVDGLQDTVRGSMNCPGMLTQQRGLIDFMPVTGGKRHNVINTGSSMNLAADGIV